MIRAGDIAAQLARQADTVAAMLLPHGKRHGAEWCAGSIDGEAGESLKVRITGSKAGLWSDFADGHRSGDLLDLWAATRGLSIGEALAQAKEYLGVVEHRVDNPRRHYSRPSREGVSRLPPQIAEWLTSVRKISPATIERFKLAARKGALMFPYLRDGELIAAKYRKVPAKEFFVDADCEPCLFGWHCLGGREREVVLCEGEMDVLALAEYGVPALSVPFGGGKGEKQVKWIEAEFDRLAAFDTIFLALDDDETGREAVSEIVHRLGRERCRIVTLPRKDANQCLIEGVSKAEIVQALTESRTKDPEQLRQACEYAEELEREFANADQPERGVRLPWKKVNDRLILRGGEVSIWAGANGHGKSQCIGQVTLSALADDWLCCIASMEFRPVKWLKRMVRQATAQNSPSQAYVRHVANWLRDRLWVFDVTGKAKGGVILEVFAYAARRYGVKLFVIDNLAKCGFAEDDYNGQKDFVDALTDFAKEADVHVCLVAHMRKSENEDKPGGKMDVKGTGGMTDMTDTFVAVWRNKPKERALKAAKAKWNFADGPFEADPDVLAKPDALLLCGKQRNGEDEPTIALWFDQATLQFLERSDAKPRPYVGFSSVSNQDAPA